MRRVRFGQLFLHGMRLAVCAGVLASSPRLLIALPFAVALFFGAFSLAHDATHGALGLPKRANAIVLSLSALVMGISGHAMRRMHLLHHAHPLAERDLEGYGARLSWWRALLAGPSNAVALRVAAFRRAGRRERVVQVFESLAALVLLVHPRYALVALGLQMTMALWASHIPHHAPARLVALCKRFGFLRSPVLLSLAYHDVHHRRPGVPCQELGRV